MSTIAVMLGVMIVVGVFLDMINTVVTTTTSTWKWWMSRNVTRGSWTLARRIATLMPEGPRREAMLSAYGPILILLLLVIWTSQQILGFALIWWGIGGVSGVDSFLDTVYYSGVVFFTVGFGEVVPSGVIPRFGALIEAFAGVLTTALVIGFLPSLYSAYSDRERLLMTLDDGAEGRVTPTTLIKAWSPDGDTSALNARFGVWEDWTTGVIETHASHPMLRLFRSHHEGQNWITALGLMCDAALHAQMIKETRNREAYWFLRRATFLFADLVSESDIGLYQDRVREQMSGDDQSLFVELYEDLEEHGFELIPFDQAKTELSEARLLWAPAMEFLIDTQLTPRGFWGHRIGLPLGITQSEGREQGVE